MKKILPLFVILAVLGVVGAAFYFMHRHREGVALAETVSYLPAETLLLLAAPDPGQTASAWKTTDLYQIWQEPEVQAFLAKPLSKATANKEFGEMWEQAKRLQPRNLFVALTALDDQNNHPHLVAGFQFTGTTADVDRLLAGAKDQLRQKFPAGKADLVNYQSHAIETFDSGDGNTLASVYLGNRYFIANDLALLKATVDRVEHRNAANQPALDKDPDFQAVLAKMPAGYETLIFGRPRSLINRLYGLIAASGQVVNEQQRAETEKIKAIAATSQIDHGKIRDTIYTLAPGHRHATGPLQMSALPLTSTDTLLYAAGVLNVPAKLDLPSTGAPGASGAGGMAGLGQLANALQARGLTLEGFRTAFGNELTVQLDWPKGTTQPSLIASLDLHDAVAAGKFVEKFAGESEGGWQVSRLDDRSYYTLALPQVQRFVSLTMTTTDKHLILGLSPSTVQSVAEREKSSSPNFTSTEPYKTVSGTVKTANVDFAYVDSRALFERTYGLLKPLALFGGAFLPAKQLDAVDLTKLPSTEAISKHLSPMILSQSEDDQGVLVESVGSVTVVQGGAGLVGMAAAAAIPFAQQQFGFFKGAQKPDPEEAKITPSQTPAALPQPSAGE